MACTNNIPEQLAVKLNKTRADIMNSWYDLFEAHNVAHCEFELDPAFELDNLVRDWYGLCETVKKIAPTLYDLHKEWLQQLVAKEEPPQQPRKSKHQ